MVKDTKYKTDLSDSEDSEDIDITKNLLGLENDDSSSDDDSASEGNYEDSNVQDEILSDDEPKATKGSAKETKNDKAKKSNDFSFPLL